MPGWSSILQRGSYIANNMGKLGMHAAKGGFGRTAAGAVWGAGLGGLYGGMSSDGSVLGGMAKGAALGAGVARYGSAGIRAGRSTGAGMGLRGHAAAYGRAFGRGVVGQARADYRGAVMSANRGYSRIRGIRLGLGGLGGGMA